MNRFGRHTSDGGGQQGSPPLLAAVEVERPRLRPRTERNGGQPRPRRRPRVLQPLPLAGLLLVLLALIGYWSVYSQSTRRSQILIAAHSLPAGRILSASDLTSAGLSGSRQVLATLVPASEQSVLVGRALTVPVAAGAPIPQAALAGSHGAASSLTLAVPALHALPGQLAPGDHITVLATFTSSTGQTQTRAVARNLEVLAVGGASGFDAANQTIPVTVALPNPSLATTLALANEAGKIDLLRVGASGKAAPMPAASAQATGP